MTGRLDRDLLPALDHHRVRAGGMHRSAQLLDGVGGTLQLACERASQANLPRPTHDELTRIALRAHPAATEDAIDAAVLTFAWHQRAQGHRLIAQVQAIRRERACASLAANVAQLRTDLAMHGGNP